jgi:hypothetical protein
MFFYCYVYVFSLLCMFCSVHSVFIVPIGTLRLSWLRFVRVFSSAVRQMPGYNLQRRGTARTLPNQAIIFTRLVHRQFYFDRSGFESQKAFQPKLLIVLFYVLFLCKCVLYYCHWVSTQLQLTNIYDIKFTEVHNKWHRIRLQDKIRTSWNTYLKLRVFSTTPYDKWRGNARVSTQKR